MSSPDTSNGRVAASARLIAAVARRMKTGIGWLAAGSAGAAVFIWAFVWWPPRTGLVPLLGAGATLIGLLLPAAVLGLCYQGLHDLLELPERVSTRTAQTVNTSTEAVRAVNSREASTMVARVWELFKRLWTLRTILSENRALLLHYGTLIRFLTPGFLLLVVAAGATGVLLILLACALGAIALAWTVIPGVG